MVTMGKRLGWNCGNVALAIACLWLGRETAFGVTTNDVTWSGGAGAGNPYWNVDANWLGGVAPTNPTKATVFFATNGQTVVGTLDADRTVGGISAGSATNTTHTVNLGGFTLTVTNSLTILSGTKALLNTLYLTNGTVRIGTDTAAGSINVNPPGNLCLSGATLDARNLSRIYVYPNPYALSQIDLRGATILGGTLQMGSLLLDGSGWYGSLMLLNNSTVVSSIIVTSNLEMGVADISQNTPQYIGNPADTFTFDATTFGRFPAGISLTVGTSATARATMLLAKPSMGTAINRVAIRAAPGGGGTFTAYLSSLGIGIRGLASGTISPRGLFDVSAMDSCLLDVVNLQLAPGQTNAVAADNEIGELDLPTGTATVGTAVIGATAGVGYGKLSLSNTMFTVTNSLTLNATASNSISVGAVSKGLDVQGTFIDGGGKIRVNFLADPAVGTTNWAIRIVGNAQPTLGAMVGSGRLTSTNAFVDPAKKAGFIYDASANYSYYALVDTNVTLLPLAIAKSQVTYEMAAGGQVLVAVSEINNGSFDPNNRATTLTISTNGGPDASSLTFNAVGDYAVNLKIVAGTDSATAGSTVHVINPNPGVTNALTWSGAASTVLMNRPEWMWSGNWLGNTPPTNPTPAILTYGTSGQTVTGKLDQARTIGGLSVGGAAFTVAHTINLGGQTLTMSGASQVGLGQSQATTLTLTNGTVKLGTDTGSASIALYNSTLMTLTNGNTQLQAYNLGNIHLGDTAWTGCTLDLRGAGIVGGVLSMGSLTIDGRTSLFQINGSMSGSTLRVTGPALLAPLLGNTYIGDPGNTFSLGGQNLGKLPAGVSLAYGLSTSSRGNLYIGLASQYGNVCAGISAAQGGSGTCTAYLTNLYVAYSTGYTYPTYASLDLSAMSTCTMDVQQLFVGADRASPQSTDNFNGTLRLPPGTMTVGTATIGASTNIGSSLVSTSNTFFTVTNSLTINKTGQLLLGIGSQSCGLVISNALSSALNLATATNNALRIVFRAAPATRPFYGLSWPGDHVSALQSLQSAGTLVVDSTGLAPKTAAIFKTGGVTYLGLPPSAGMMVMFR